MTEEKTKTNEDRIENIKQAIFERLEEIEDINEEKLTNFEKAEEDMYDRLHEQMSNEIIYYADQEAIIKEYGIINALLEWNESAYAYSCKINAEILAFTLLEEMFNKKYEMEELFDEYKGNNEEESNANNADWEEYYEIINENIKGDLK